ncbi:MAG: DUF4276 family protein [Pseudomonadota bacterium]
MTDWTRLNFIVEGQTEETFVNRIIKPHLASYCINVSVICVTTGRKRGRVFRGGMPNYSKIKNDVIGWLNEDREAYLTTFFDFYGLTNDFPGYKEALSKITIAQKLNCLEKSFSEDIDNIRLIPYVQMYEFEALLYSEVSTLDETMQIYSFKSRLNELNDIINSFINPEEINDNPNTAPSKRLLNLYEGYEKINHGCDAAELIGLALMREKCYLFNRWLNALEALSPGQD